MSNTDLTRQLVDLSNNGGPAVAAALAEIDALAIAWYDADMEPHQLFWFQAGLHFAWLIAHEHPGLGAAVGALMQRYYGPAEDKDRADAARYSEEIALLAKLAWYSDGGERTEGAS